MAERRIRSKKIEESVTPVTKTSGRAITGCLIYIKPDKLSTILGALIADDRVSILDATMESKGWLKIKSDKTNITGFVDKNKIV